MWRSECSPRSMAATMRSRRSREYGRMVAPPSWLSPLCHSISACNPRANRSRRALVLFLVQEGDPGPHFRAEVLVAGRDVDTHAHRDAGLAAVGLGHDA